MLATSSGNRKFERGISLVEILIVIAIIVIALTSFLGVASFSLQVLNSIKKNNIANFLAQETIEAVRNFRDGTDWNVDGLGTLLGATPYYPEKTAASPAAWILTQGTETINGFSRKLVFENVMRDTNDNIVESGGTNDPDSKKITATVSWGNKEVKIVTYFTNWQ